ncbi:MAG: RNA methyltransferase [Gemmatimonadota bacterium]
MKSRREGRREKPLGGLADSTRRRVQRLHRRKQREREAQVLVEGIRSVRQALLDGARPSLALCSPRLETLEGGAALAHSLAASADSVLDVADEDLAAVSATESPQGVLAVVAEPGRVDLATLTRGAGVVLVLDQVQDPGNVGTLIRSARAFGATGVVALDGTADPWSPKAVRAAAGTCFGIPVAQCTVARWREAADASGVQVLIAEASGAAVEDVPETSAARALVVGNEGAGVRSEVRAPGARTVAIPLAGGVESLNAAVAGSVLLHALRGHGPNATRGGRV